MDRIDPENRRGLFEGLDIEIDRDGFTVAAHEHALKLVGRARVDLLMRNVRRHVDEISRPRLGRELQMFAPAHARFPLDDVDDAFERAVMVRPGLGVGVDVHRARPELLRADASEIDRSLTLHTGGLCRIWIEVRPGNYPYAVMLPVAHRSMASRMSAPNASPSCGRGRSEHL